MDGRRTTKRTDAMTLLELLIAIVIVGLLAGMVMFASYSATERAKERRTHTLIANLDAIIRGRWDTYRARRMPVNTGGDQFVDQNNDGVYNGIDSLISDLNGNGVYDAAPDVRSAGRMRLDALRDLMRLEMPDRWTDVTDGPIAIGVLGGDPIARPAASVSHLRTYNTIVGAINPPPAEAIAANQEAECLYIVVMNALKEDGDTRDLFTIGDTGDVDHDGFPEFVDGWGRPIMFLRWPVGFASDLQVVAQGKALVDVPSSQEMQIDVDAGTYRAFSRVNGAYVGGVLCRATGSSAVPDPTAMGRITGYRYNTVTDTASVIVSTPTQARYPSSYTLQPALMGQGIAKGDDLLILAPDPFDPSGVYPMYSPMSPIAPSPADTSRPSHAVYPLIFSSGPDKCYGIATDTNPGSATPLRYAANYVALNPFYMDATTRLMAGMTVDNPAEEYFVANGWRDNIHNHLIGAK